MVSAVILKLEYIDQNLIADQLHVSGDIIAATNTLSKPFLPPLQNLGSWIEHAIQWANSPTRFPLQFLGRGFLAFEPYGLTSEALYVLHAIGSTTISINHYLQGIPAGLTLGQIAKVRTAVHQRLLLLPTEEELVEEGHHRPSVYNSCRTTALIYSIAVIFPIPNTFKLFQTLVSRLKLSIEMERIDKDNHLSDLLLWMLILGGVAALDKPERSWYVSQLVLFAKRWNMYMWRSVEKILGSFLWLDSACGQGGRRLWSEVINRIE